MNISLTGNLGAGKSTILKEQMKTQFRGVVSIADLVQWNNENGFEETTKKIGEYQEIKKKEYDELKTQRDKLAKQAKSNKKIVVPDPPSENMYKFVSKEIFEELLTNRLSSSDCQIGVVFDNVTSDLVENPETIMEYIEDVLKDENLTLAYFDYPKDNAGLEVCHYIDWSNYIEELHKVRKRKPEGTKKIKRPTFVRKPVNKDKENEKEKEKDKKKETGNFSPESTNKFGKTQELSGANDSKTKEKTQISPELVDKFHEMFELFIAKNIPNAKLIFIKGDHFIANKKSDLFNSAVDEFLSE